MTMPMVAAMGLLLVVTGCANAASPSAELIVSTRFTAGPCSNDGSCAIDEPFVKTKLQAVSGSGHVTTVVTDARGIATFHLAPGTYRVRVPPGPNVVCFQPTGPVTLVRDQVRAWQYQCGQP